MNKRSASLSLVFPYIVILQGFSSKIPVSAGHILLHGVMLGFWCIWRQPFPDCINRLAFSRWDSWLGGASLDHASDLATHLLTVFSTVCVGWRPTSPLSFVAVFMLSVLQLTAWSLCLVLLRWDVWPSRIWRNGWLLLSCRHHRRLTERSRIAPWASVAPSYHSCYCLCVTGAVPGFLSREIDVM